MTPNTFETPLRRLASSLLCLALAEDFAVVDGANGTLPWLAVALPSGWAPEADLLRGDLDAAGRRISY